MSERARDRASELFRRPRTHVRSRVAITFAVMVILGCVTAGALLFINAQAERRALRLRASAAATALSFAFDQEVAAGNALLKGLRSSPALRDWDPKSLYDQFSATAIPQGSWLIVSDLEKQVVNTLVPFGSKLPKLKDFPSYPEAVNRVRDRGWTVSGRINSLVKPGASIVALGLRVNDENGSMRGFISTILSQERLGTVLLSQDLPAGWSRGLYDRKLKPIVTEHAGEISSAMQAPSGLRELMGAEDSVSGSEGMEEGLDDHGVPVLVAYRSSGSTNWVAVVAAPLSLIDKPVMQVLSELVVPSTLLFLAGGVLAYFTARHVEQPLDALSLRVSETSGMVAQLSNQLLALQEDERQRIARELHDSTAQGLVAASLGLTAVERQLAPGSAVRQAVSGIADQLDDTLKEIRIFSYLLHPPRLTELGLKTTLEEFIGGFSDRAGLHATIDFPDVCSDLPPDLQRAILRVVQEALANVHRHADARAVIVKVRRSSRRLAILVQDDGRGIRPQNPARSSQPRFGVGIPGMRARLVQFGGTLRLRSGPSGTRLLAYVPLV